LAVIPATSLLEGASCPGVLMQLCCACLARCSLRCPSCSPILSTYALLCHSQHQDAGYGGGGGSGGQKVGVLLLHPCMAFSDARWLCSLDCNHRGHMRCLYVSYLRLSLLFGPCRRAATQPSGRSPSGSLQRCVCCAIVVQSSSCIYVLASRLLAKGRHTAVPEVGMQPAVIRHSCSQYTHCFDEPGLQLLPCSTQCSMPAAQL
jgi:hypothetical protein